jgi:hypothetical protein
VKLSPLAAAGGVIAAGSGLAALAAGKRRWQAATADARRRLEAANSSAADSARDLEQLPPVVQRYLRAALPNGRKRVRHARVASHGLINMGTPPQDHWKRFSATQDFYPAAPGFVWDARVQMAPGLAAFVRDSFIDGEGAMLATLLGLFPVVDSRDTPEMAEASLMRYLAEMVWFPTAFLPGQGVSWTEASASADTAQASIAAGAAAASLDFVFGQDGLPVSCTATRFNDTLRGRFPWGGQYLEWTSHEGLMIPSRCEVFWNLPSGYFAYWRGTVTPVYEFRET